MADKKLTGDPRVDFGWFSRRHETSTAHLAAQTRWQAEHGKESKREMGVERQAERASRTPQEQIAILDRRLGVGQGATRERAKLATLISK